MDLNVIAKHLEDHLVSSWEGYLIKLVTGVLGFLLFRFIAKVKNKRYEELSNVDKARGGAYTFLFIVFAVSAVGMPQAQPVGGFSASVLGAGPVYLQFANGTNSSKMESKTTIGGANGGPVSTNGFDFQIVARVVNLGEPSVAWNWKAYLVMPNHKEQIPCQLPSYGGMDGVAQTPFGPVKITPDNSLLQSLLTTQLGHNQAIIGWIIIHVNGMQSVPWGSRFIITFEDASGHVAKLDHVWETPLSQ